MFFLSQFDIEVEIICASFEQGIVAGFMAHHIFDAFHPPFKYSLNVAKQGHIFDIILFIPNISQGHLGPKKVPS